MLRKIAKFIKKKALIIVGVLVFIVFWGGLAVIYMWDSHNPVYDKKPHRSVKRSSGGWGPKPERQRPAYKKPEKKKDKFDQDVDNVRDVIKGVRGLLK